MSTVKSPYKVPVSPVLAPLAVKRFGNLGTYNLESERAGVRDHAICDHIGSILQWLIKDLRVVQLNTFETVKTYYTSIVSHPSSLCNNPLGFRLCSLLTLKFHGLLIINLKLDSTNINLRVRPDTKTKLLIVQNLRREFVICRLIQDLSDNISDIDGQGILDIESVDVQGHEWNNLLALSWWQVHLKSLRREVSADGCVGVGGGVHGEGESFIGWVGDGEVIDL